MRLFGDSDIPLWSVLDSRGRLRFRLGKCSLVKFNDIDLISLQEYFVYV